MADCDYYFKIFLIGDAGVGKSNILQRYVQNKFTDSYISTLGAKFNIKIIQVQDLIVKMQIWDTPGQERYRSMIFPFFKAASLIMIIFDKNDRESYENLDIWIEEIKKRAQDDVFIILVGNKCDIEPQVSTDEAQEKALKYQMLYIEVSAKNNQQIDSVFEMVSRSLIEIHNAKLKEKDSY